MPDFPRGVAPPTFGARLASRQLAAGEAAWFFNDPHELANRAAPEQPEPTKPPDKVQIGPLDV